MSNSKPSAEPTGATRAVLDVCELTVRRSRRVVIDRLSFTAAPGEIVAVLGPNGVGKSSLLRGICGLLPSSGCVKLGGEDLLGMNVRQRARRIAFVPQVSSLSAALPVSEVVRQGRFSHRGAWGVASREDRAATQHAMAATKLDVLAHRSFATLSHGERQRVMLARALCTGARVLCLDEPTAALDIAHALRFFELTRTLRDSGHTIVIVLHQLADALRFADRALLLAPGAPARLGPVEQVVAADPIRGVYGVTMRQQAGLEFDLHEAGER